MSPVVLELPDDTKNSSLITVSKVVGCMAKVYSLFLFFAVIKM
jgi:hypothetical protein